MSLDCLFLELSVFSGTWISLSLSLSLRECADFSQATGKKMKGTWICSFKEKIKIVSYKQDKQSFD